ncbi:MAG TPA: heavy metal translocating P-type ATPase [Enteractinococcus helveticum]|uniref:Heavy metal translocating P-type ATPase n=1 Tax=Enteractinococcus helveticum TaxID=1837282 RepID=A0A921FQW1_9MICC|nr:heavy metal translocating P-type ATPase [Enteractinococcus helveticum]HJF15512.1 heavy metal translocating P-type ATPase [Enteractinococcus helveticum]
MSTETTETREVELDISGMSCASCVGRVERQLEKLDGVEASVNLPLNQAFLKVPAGLEDRILIDAVSKAGYDATIHGDEPEQTVETTEDEVEAPKVDDAPGAAELKPRLIGSAIATIPLFIISMFSVFQFPHWGWVAMVLSLPVTFWGGWPFHRGAVKAARHGGSTMDTLVSIGVTAAWVYSTVELFLDPTMTLHAGSHDHSLYYETAGVVTTFLLLGRYLEARAKNRASQALRSLLNLAASKATVLRDGQEVVVDASTLQVGDEFVVRPGEKIATDGFVVSGHSAIDTSLITGESVPVEVSENDTVTGATINTSGRLVVRATRTGSDTTLAQMGKLVTRAQSEKAPIARLADRISAVFVPIVLVIALVTLIAWLIFGDPATAFRAAVTVLIIACPCALGLATPIGLLAGTGRASQMGILISGPQVLEDSRGVDTVVLDKTGTVTEGQMAVSDVIAFDGHTADDVVVAAAAVELGSEHPIAAAIVEAGKAVNELPEVTEFSSTAGGGVVGTIWLATGQHRVAAGRSSFIVEHTGALSAADEHALADAEAAGATAVWVAIDGQLAGIVSLQDQIKDTSAQAIAELKDMGITPMLLTGDNESVARQVAAEVGINPDHVFAGVRPEDKVDKVKELQAAGKTVAMAGDGVNDAPALAQADLGIAMGSGTDVAREAADITVMGSSLTQVSQSLQLSRKTLRIIRTNLFWAFAYNTAGIPIAALGLLNPMFAGAAMAASSVLVVLNSLRLTRFGR